MDSTATALLAFAMVLTRMSAFFLVAPVFSWSSIPVQIKIALVVMLSFFFFLIKPAPVGYESVSVVEAVINLSFEAIYGFALGLVIALLFSAIQVAGRIMERQMGLSMAQMLDPMTGEQGQPVSILLEMLFILLFLSLNGHHALLMIISRSFDVFPIGMIPSVEYLTEAVLQSGSFMLSAGLRLAGPVLAAFLIVMVVLGIFARIIPEMNVLFISLPLKVGLALIMMILFLPFLETYITEFSELLTKLLPI